MIAVTIRTAKIVAFIQFIPRISLPSVPSARSSFRPPHDLETGPPQFGDDAQRELLDIAVRVLFDGCGDEAHKFEFLPERWHPTFPMCRTLPTRTIATLSRSSTSLLNSEGKGSSFRVEIRTAGLPALGMRTQPALFPRSHPRSHPAGRGSYQSGPV